GDLIETEKRQKAQIFADFGVFGVHPELIKRIRARHIGVQPHRPALGFAELRSVSASDQRGYCGIDPLPLDTPDEFGAGGDIAPLSGGTQLEAAPVSTE